MKSPLDIIIVGLSITSSWGNGHATTYRSLVKELAARGHRVLFLERDQPWYAANRDLPKPPYRDRKSTRLNSSHVSISYAVFCLKKKKKKYTNDIITTTYR